MPPHSYHLDHIRDDHYKEVQNPFHLDKVVLKRREGCKVEISIKPLCSTHIQDKLQIVVDNAFNGKRTIGTLSMEIATEVTTSFNYSEVKEESYLGVGGFGIVYKWTLL
ncbi:hypothetical protein EIN_193190 [Entamoeba invadens IP1]|uniref:Uncharacterized protein n=1 Tax=Entamoeba invadens IP1 TaxID=370355 RepID=A0A0A1U6Y4_ENTIV|nr:hypothetical protein EIN_193190 [Entamoeba invadens IP1]ELP88680.1 hypothetical protein EIN_193190 [Entamoeba invadens IP1]|eukprot:XP_004255451.1 hypothetical protein EIN_193190 [Entamoeba invadens IP1]